MENLSFMAAVIHLRQRCLIHGMQQHPHKVNTVTATTSESNTDIINVFHLQKALFSQSVCPYLSVLITHPT